MFFMHPDPDFMEFLIYPLKNAERTLWVWNAPGGFLGVLGGSKRRQRPVPFSRVTEVFCSVVWVAFKANH